MTNNRTEELRQLGYGDAMSPSEKGEYENTPFVDWGDSYNWLEGTIINFFDTKYGQCATLEVTATYDGAELVAKSRDHNGQEVRGFVVAGAKINVGLYSAALKGKIPAEKINHNYHIAFEGWGESKAGNKYRIFTAFDLGEADTPQASTAPTPPAPTDAPQADTPPTSTAAELAKAINEVPDLPF